MYSDPVDYMEMLNSKEPNDYISVAELIESHRQRQDKLIDMCAAAAAKIVKYERIMAAAEQAVGEKRWLKIIKKASKKGGGVV